VNMGTFRKKIYAAAGYNTTYVGTGRKEFNPNLPLRDFEEYLKETANGTLSQLKNHEVDEGIIGSFMSARFLNQANLPGFLPFMVPSLQGKPCTGVEGACGTGGRAISMGIRSVLSDLSDVVFVAGFEMQNTMKSVYGADVLAGAAYYNKERKKGQAFFFPGLFSDRAGAYFEQFGTEVPRQAMAKWYEIAILNARKNPKAQEFHNKTQDLFALGMTPPNAQQFVPFLNLYDCSKVSDGASSLMILSEKGLERSGLSKSEVVEIIGIGEAEDNITEDPKDPTFLSTTMQAVQKALYKAKISKEDIAVLEIHDCFSISALLALEAIGFANKGQAPQFILDGNTSLEGTIPTNLSGGLCGFGHPTGASGVRQMVDLLHQLTAKAENQADIKKPYGMMISMGGNDKTVTCLIVKAPK
jgi:acetyl-CoA C-acetyltransferase